jgi:hypothetical protein
MEAMILLGITVDTEALNLSLPERSALSVLSSAIATGECVCGGTWDMVPDEDSGISHPYMVHQNDCPGTSLTAQRAVRKIIRHVIYQSMASDMERDED